MPKDNAFYFSHDYNARNDEKIKRLLMKHGLEGYGLYWAIIEDLYNNANALRTDYESIAFDMRCSDELVKSVINNFNLFVVEDGFFGSLSVGRRLDERFNKSIKAKESANKRWNKKTEDANALRTQSEGNAIKEIKGNKEKEIIIPEFSEFFDFAKSLKEVYTPELDFSLKAKYDSWVENNWKDGNNEKIKNWKTKLRNTIPFLKKVYKDKNDSGLSLAHTKQF
jgi:hypothetical protein